jgi:UDPglucose--hexose-1-phosphate uridylyltransferase
MPQFRKDPVTQRWVIIASERAKRPRHHGSDEHRTQASAASCPFCAGNEAMTPPEIWAQRESSSPTNAPGWQVRVVPNKYPALENQGDGAAIRNTDYESSNGLGVHEVIIESPDHATNIGALGLDQFANILRAYRERMRALRSDPRWRYLILYKNQGELAGATLEHVHSQLLALPFVPSEAAEELINTETHYHSTGACLYCDIVQHEMERGERLVSSTERFVALCPFAPRFGYEICILPKNHAAAFEENTEDDIFALAYALKDALSRLNRVLDSPPFNYVIHSAPAQQTALPHYHWHIEIMPQVTRAAGFEWGSGMFMNSVAPEDAARSLRDAAL